MGPIMTVAAGEPVVRQVKLAYRAGLPILLHGRHGVGKSVLLHRAAEELGIDIIVRDLSLMEPPDLLGIPRVGGDGRTHYAAPSFLPADGSRGLLVFEELNRAQRYVVAPCLQLLTARALNDYTLPAGWIACAAVNDAEEGYLVEDLDDALLSRFVRVRLEPDVETWVAWARQNHVNAKVLSFVECNPNVFDEPQSNPRAWTYVGRLLDAAEAGAFAPDDVVVAVAGLVGETWAGAFTEHVGAEHPLPATAIVDEYKAHASTVRSWKKQSRTDLMSATWTNVRNYLQRQSNYDATVADEKKKRNVERFIRDLVPDIQAQAREWLEDRGFTELLLPRKGH